MNTHTKPSRPAFLANPFYTIAGWKALAWGLLGMAVATAGSMAAHLHYHGLMHYGSAPNDSWWCYTAEHLVVWLVPAAIFYVAGLLLSSSRIRLIDVLGTTAFAQIPFAVMNLFLPARAGTNFHRSYPRRTCRENFTGELLATRCRMADTVTAVSRAGPVLAGRCPENLMQPARVEASTGLCRRHYRRRHGLPPHHFSNV